MLQAQEIENNALRGTLRNLEAASRLSVRERILNDVHNACRWVTRVGREDSRRRDRDYHQARHRKAKWTPEPCWHSPKLRIFKLPRSNSKQSHQRKPAKQASFSKNHRSPSIKKFWLNILVNFRSNSFHDGLSTGRCGSIAYWNSEFMIFVKLSLALHKLVKKLKLTRLQTLLQACLFTGLHFSDGDHNLLTDKLAKRVKKFI